MQNSNVNKQGLKKVKHIILTDLKKPQQYLKDTMFTNKDTSLPFNLGSQCVNELKAIFPYKVDHFVNYIPTHKNIQLPAPNLETT